LGQHFGRETSATWSGAHRWGRETMARHHRRDRARTMDIPMTPERCGPFRSRGFALVIVLWSMAMLALLGTQLTSTARLQLRLAAAARDTAIAEAAADGAIQYVMFALCTGGQVALTGEVVRIPIGESVVAVTVEDETHKINPNVASTEILFSLLRTVGVDPPLAARLAGAIVDWRSRSRTSVLGGLKVDQYRERGLPYRSSDRPFDSIDEIGLVPDMTQEIMTRLTPWLSVYQDSDVREQSGTSPVASVMVDARSLRHDGQSSGFVSGNLIKRVTAVAVVQGRSRFVRSAVVMVRLEPGTTNTNLVGVLTWE
jgi:general secretion pathway protein K